MQCRCIVAAAERRGAGPPKPLFLLTIPVHNFPRCLHLEGLLARSSPVAEDSGRIETLSSRQNRGHVQGLLYRCRNWFIVLFPRVVCSVMDSRGSHSSARST